MNMLERTWSYARKRYNLLGYIRNARALPAHRWMRPEDRDANIRAYREHMVVIRREHYGERARHEPVGVAITNPDGTLRSLEEIERDVIRYAMDNETSITTVAKQLGVGRSTLYRHGVQMIRAEARAAG